eukprot:7391960-Prymnesium_polylepis.2
MYKGVPSTKAVELAPQFSREEASRVKVDTLKQVGFNSNLASLTSRSVSSKLLDVAGADPKVVDQRNAHRIPPLELTIESRADRIPPLFEADDSLDLSPNRSDRPDCVACTPPAGVVCDGCEGRSTSCVPEPISAHRLEREVALASPLSAAPRSPHCA